MSYFVIVGGLDNPLYEVEFSKETNTKEHLYQFIIHSALDILDELAQQSVQPYLKVVDRFNEFNVSAYLLPCSIRFLILHTNLNQDGIKNFLVDVHELYLKVMLNPLKEFNSTISPNGLFDQRVKQYARKWLS